MESKEFHEKLKSLHYVVRLYNIDVTPGHQRVTIAAQDMGNSQFNVGITVCHPKDRFTKIGGKMSAGRKAIFYPDMRINLTTTQGDAKRNIIKVMKAVKTLVEETISYGAPSPQGAKVMYELVKYGNTVISDNNALVSQSLINGLIKYWDDNYAIKEEMATSVAQ